MKSLIYLVSVLFAIEAHGQIKATRSASNGEIRKAEPNEFCIRSPEDFKLFRKIVRDKPNGKYKVCADIDFNGQTLNAISFFDGSLDGQSHTLSNLNISGTLFIELGSNSIIEKLKFQNVTADVATLAGLARGKIRQVRVQGGDVGSTPNALGVGGLVVVNYGEISHSSFSGNVRHLSRNTGGLIGLNDGNVYHSYSTGRVDGSFEVGGLIGYSKPSIVRNSHSHANVSGLRWVGGLIGRTDATQVSFSYATGDVLGSDAVGGLIGRYLADPIFDLTDCYSAGALVQGGSNVGGLIGITGPQSPVIDSFAANKVISLEFSTRGPLIGAGSSSSQSFYDQTLSPLSNTIGNGITTQEMTNPNPNSMFGQVFFNRTGWTWKQGSYPELN